MPQPSEMKVLVVEDDSVMRTIEIKNVKEQGYQVLEAEDGQKAIELVSSERPNLVLLDLLLPTVDGFHVLETIRKHQDPQIAKTPVLVFSNLWSDKDLLRVQDLKVDGYFVKASTTMEEIVAKIREVLSAQAS